MYTNKKFAYQPLDQHQHSIRLVNILPSLSDEGVLQCQLSHASTSATYMCLSYVWDYRPGLWANLGSTPKDIAILINGRLSYVRENLAAFLYMARRNATQYTRNKHTFDLATPIWIDAICIDQSNVSERIHQVAQMGEIYSRATNVHVWFGRFMGDLDPAWRDSAEGPSRIPGSSCALTRATRILEDCVQSLAAKVPGPASYRLFRPSVACMEVCQNSIIGHIFVNPYWRRAWTVQEIVLARRLTFWADAIPMEPESILGIEEMIDAERESELGTYISHCGYRGFANVRFQFEYYRKIEDLIHLLDKFHQKQCMDPRDRVYSLLAFCSEYTRVPVDYEISLNSLAMRVLRSHRYPLCVCITAIVSKALDLEQHSTGDLLVLDLSDEAWIEFEVPESSVRTERLESGSLHHFVDLSWVCGCFDAWHNRKLDYESNLFPMIITRHKNSGLVFRLSLKLLPLLLPNRVQRCSYSKLETRPAKGGLVRLGYGAFSSNTTPQPRLVTILENRRGRFKIRETLEGLGENQEIDLSNSITQEHH